MSMIYRLSTVIEKAQSLLPEKLNTVKRLNAVTQKILNSSVKRTK